MAKTRPLRDLTLGYQVVDHEFKLYGGVVPIFDLSPTTTVGKLRGVIKTERPNEFAHVDPHTLVLWKILKPLPLDARGKAPTINELLQRFRNDQGSVALELNPFAPVSQYFGGNLPAMHLHLLVQARISDASGRQFTTSYEQLLRPVAGGRASIAFYGQNPPQPVVHAI